MIYFAEYGNSSCVIMIIMVVSYLDDSIMAEKTEDMTIFTQQFRAFYLQYAEELLFFARKFVDNQTAEDIVHDIFLKIWDKKSTVVVEREIRTYLLTIVQNACYDYLKHQAISDTFMEKAVQQLRMEELEYLSSSSDDLFDKQKLEAIYTTIEELPPKSRDIFKKAYLEGQKHTAIAEELNISPRTVETHVYKSLKYLRDSLVTFLFLLS